MGRGIGMEMQALGLETLPGEECRRGLEPLPGRKYGAGFGAAAGKGMQGVGLEPPRDGKIYRL